MCGLAEHFHSNGHSNGADHTSRGKVVRRGYEGRTVRRDAGALPPKRIPVPEIVAELPVKKQEPAAANLVGAVKKVDNVATAKGNKNNSPFSKPNGSVAKHSTASDAAHTSVTPATSRFKVPANTAGVWKEGVVAKASDKKMKSWDSRWLSLLLDHIIIYREDKSKEVERINLGNVVSAAIDPSTSKQFGTVFLLNKLDGQSVAFRVGAQTEADVWVDAINACLNHESSSQSTQPSEQTPSDAFPDTSAFTDPIASLTEPQDDPQRLYNPFASYPAFVPPYAMYAAMESSQQPSSFAAAAAPPGYVGAVGSSGFNSAFYPAPSVPTMQGTPYLAGSLFTQPELPPAINGLWGPPADPFASLLQLQHQLPMQYGMQHQMQFPPAPGAQNTAPNTNLK